METAVESRSATTHPTAVSRVAVAISGEGLQVAFASAANNLVSGDTNAKADVFMHDLVTGQNELVSRDSDGNLGDGDSGAGGFWQFWSDLVFIPYDGIDLSRDGRIVVFTSAADNLVKGEPTHQIDIFARDRLTAHTTRESVSTDGSLPRVASKDPQVVADGSALVFYSDAGEDLIGAPDTYVFCRARLFSRFAGIPRSRELDHFELVNGNQHRIGELAVVLVSCTGLDAFPLPGGLRLYLTFDACTIVGLSQLAILSGSVDFDGNAVMPSFVFPDLPVGFRIYGSVITTNGQSITATTDPIVIDVRS
jgi:hypothetical protein